jgi:8-oxo-dGTP diphosphatase
MNYYVIGFLIKDDKVALIEKNRPEWQKGLLNGIGGHIEPGETPFQAMVREFEEEAGMRIPDWEYYCTMKYPEALVFCFRKFGSDNVEIRTMTDEFIDWYPLDPLPEKVIPNLNWLIPLAHYDDDYLRTVDFSRITSTMIPIRKEG